MKKKTKTAARKRLKVKDLTSRAKHVKGGGKGIGGPCDDTSGGTTGGGMGKGI